MKFFESGCNGGMENFYRNRGREPGMGVGGGTVGVLMGRTGNF